MEQYIETLLQRSRTLTAQAYDAGSVPEEPSGGVWQETAGKLPEPAAASRLLRTLRAMELAERSAARLQTDPAAEGREPDGQLQQLQTRQQVWTVQDGALPMRFTDALPQTEPAAAWLASMEDISRFFERDARRYGA